MTNLFNEDKLYTLVQKENLCHRYGSIKECYWNEIKECVNQSIKEAVRKGFGETRPERLDLPSSHSEEVKSIFEGWNKCQKQLKQNQTKYMEGL